MYKIVQKSFFFLVFSFHSISFADYFSVENQNNLLDFKSHAGEMSSPSENYDRKKHFGAWVKQPKFHECLNTRGVVLMNHSQVPVKLSDRGCFVVEGEWNEPYTGQTYTDAKQLDIDHVVPLKNAYQNGAWSWSSRERCLYANNLAYSFHLLPVDSSENRQKSDKSPADYIPPNQNYTCEYLKIWLKIKYIWHLQMDSREASGILSEVQNQHCDNLNFKVDSSEIEAQKKFNSEHTEICGS